MTRKHSNFRVLFLSVLLLYIPQAFQYEVGRDGGENPDTRDLQEGREFVGDRKLLSAGKAAEVEDVPLKEVKTLNQEHTGNVYSFNTKTTTSSALEGRGKSVQGGDAMVKKEAMTRLTVPGMSRNEESEVMDSEETPVDNPSRVTTPHASMGTATDDDDDDGLSKGGIVAITFVLLFVLVLAIVALLWCARNRILRQHNQTKYKEIPSEEEALDPQEDAPPHIHSTK